MITGVNHLTLAVKDIDQSFDFYRSILGFKPLVKWEKGAYFLIDDFWLCLNVDVQREPSHCYTHYAFTVTPEDFAAVAKKIIDSGVIVFKENSSPGESLYFLDPDGHKLEIHVGTWHDRIAAKREKLGSWQQVQWFV